MRFFRFLRRLRAALFGRPRPAGKKTAWPDEPYPLIRDFGLVLFVEGCYTAGKCMDCCAEGVPVLCLLEKAFDRYADCSEGFDLCSDCLGGYADDIGHSLQEGLLRALGEYPGARPPRPKQETEPTPRTPQPTEGDIPF